MILELGDELPNQVVLCPALSGYSSASIQLAQYSWTHWDDPVDVSHFITSHVFAI